MKPLRRNLPQRTFEQRFRNYRSYKRYLRADFNQRCGYCDDVDYLCNGINGFHIDHFIPLTPYKAQREDIETNYGNLVYSCPYCNRAKSNDWPSGDIDANRIGDRGYIDPCNAEYDEHIERYDNGRIRPKTDLGIYIFKALKLFLRRHQLAWKYELLGDLLDELTEELRNHDGDKKEYFDEYLNLVSEYKHYEKMFRQQL